MYIPLVTVLLAISEQSFFLAHWNTFLSQIIMHNIKVSGLNLREGIYYSLRGPE